MDKIIKEILKDGGKCLIIEDGEPIGVILNMEEYELLRNKSQTNEIKPEAEKSLELADIDFTDNENVTLEDLGLDPDIHLPKDF